MKHLIKFKMGICHFKKESKCVLHKNICFLCSHKIKTIDVINEMKDYINIVTTRNHSKNQYIIAVLALLISFITLILKLLEES